MRDAVNGVVALAVMGAPLASSVPSGKISSLLPAPKLRLPPSVARFATVPLFVAAVAPRANKNIEPFSDTLVVADTRPDWFTAKPTKVALPRGTSMLPVLLTRPAAPLTSTSKPRRAGMLALTSLA